MFSISKLPLAEIYVNFELKIYYPPSYEYEAWHYEKANIDTIRKAIDDFE